MIYLDYCCSINSARVAVSMVIMPWKGVQQCVAVRLNKKVDTTAQTVWDATGVQREEEEEKQGPALHQDQEEDWERRFDRADLPVDNTLTLSFCCPLESLPCRSALPHALLGPAAVLDSVFPFPSFSARLLRPPPPREINRSSLGTSGRDGLKKPLNAYVRRGV